MLLEITKMEQRYEAVLGVLRDGLTVREVAEAFGVSRQAVHKWLRRYEAGGLDALRDQPHRTRSCPHQMPAEVEARLLELRRQHPGWGPVTLLHRLGREKVEPLPSRAAIARSLVRHGLVVPKPQRKRVADYKRWERSRPNELWQMDIVGGVLLEDGTECKVLTGIDDHSRFCVCAGVMVRATARPVCGFLVEALERHGIPEEILTDNGKVFTNRYGLAPTEVLFDKICRENGITHRLTPPRTPSANGKVERFHRTLRHEFLAGQIFSNLEIAQKGLRTWIDSYNLERPHQSLKMATPANRYVLNESKPVVPLDDSALVSDRSGDDWITRTVASTGVISVAWQVFSVGKHRSGEVVDVRVSDTLLEVWSGNELIKTVLRTSKKGIRKKRAQLPRSEQN